MSNRFVWRHSASFLRIAVLIALLSIGGAEAAAQSTPLRWHEDNLDRAAQLSRTSGKPLFIVFRCVR